MCGNKVGKGKGKSKGKALPRTGHEGPEEEYKYRSTLPSNSALRWGWMVNVTPRPLYPRKDTRYPLYRRLGGPQGRSGRVLKISLPPEFDPRTVRT